MKPTYIMRAWRPPDPPRPTLLTLFLSLLWTSLSVCFMIPVGVYGLMKSQNQCIEKVTRHEVCSNIESESIPHFLNPQLTTLELTHSKVSSLANAEVYEGMKVLNLTANRLKSIGATLHHPSKLHTLIVRENKIERLETNDFVNLRALKKLDVAKNLIQEIEARTFENLTLKELDLSQNAISRLTLDMIKGLETLESLRLSGNKLVTLCSLKSLQYLNFLDLSYNNITTFGGMLPDVKRLNVKRCTLNRTTFLSGVAVMELNLAENEFREVPKPLPLQMTALILDSNPISKLGPKSFSHLPNLQDVSLSSSDSLQSIHPEAFSANHKLRRVIFERDTSLTDIDSRMFSNMALLTELSLRASGLESLDNFLTARLIPSKLDLRGNPLRCDCRLSWLRDLSLSYLNSSSGKNAPHPFDNDTVRIRCAEPKNFRQQFIYDVPSSLFECKIRPLVTLILVPVSVLLLLAGIVYLAVRYRHKLPFNKSKTAPSSSKPYFEKTYMVPADEYEGIYHIQRNAPVRMIPVTEL